MKKTIATLSLLGLMACSSTQATAPEPVTNTISGTIYYQGEILRGQYIYVCPGNKAATIQNYINANDQHYGKPNRNDELYPDMTLSTAVMMGEYQATQIPSCQKITANSEGKFTTPELDPGEYVLFAPYHGDDVFAYWLTPASTGSEIDLNQNNTKDFALKR